MAYIDILKQPQVSEVDSLIGLSDNQVKQIKPDGPINLILEYDKPVDFDKVRKWYNNQGNVYIKYAGNLIPACVYVTYDPDYGFDQFDVYGSYSYITYDDAAPRPVSVAVVAYDQGNWVRSWYVPTNSISYEEQELDDTQKEQSRINIGAASQSDYDDLQKFDIFEHYKLSYSTDKEYNKVGEYTDRRVTLYRPLVITQTQNYYTYIRVHSLTQAQYNALDAAVLAKFPTATGDITGVYEYFYGHHKILTGDSIANLNLVVKGDKFYVIA